MKTFWTKKHVLVTGGNGFIGSHVVALLRKKGAIVRIPTHNLLSIKNVEKEINGCEIVLHLAAKVAGIQYNLSHPVEMFESNVVMTSNILSVARRSGVERILLVSSACVYPHDAPVPTPESQGFISDPEPTNLGYGWSKRVTELLGRFYVQEYGMNIAIARPFNAYGPGDNFEPSTSHVVPSLIKRVLGGEDPLIVWGSGNQTRSFIYVEDLAKGLIKLVEHYPQPDPINIGGREEVSIKSLARLITQLSRKKTAIIFDSTKPDGQLRRKPDTKKAEKLIGFKAETPLEVGLKKTIVWYQKQHSLSLLETKSKASKR